MTPIVLVHNVLAHNQTLVTVTDLCFCFTTPYLVSSASCQQEQEEEEEEGR